MSKYKTQKENAQRLALERATAASERRKTEVEAQRAAIAVKPTGGTDAK